MQSITIKRLSQQTISLISAGEVITSPASVVKELVDNALDAGATKVEVWLESGGVGLIVVKDNGAGMDKDDLALSVERYTTSKLDQGDIQNITSLGFRGEALSAIAAVSKLTILTRRMGRPHKLTISPVEPLNIVPTVHDCGTKVEVRDLFFATPARLKFLRSEKSETTACLSILKRIALSHWNVCFICHVNQKEVFRCEPLAEESSEASIRQRALSILGKDFVDSCIYLNKTTDQVNIFGLVGLPTCTSSSVEDQIFFVNSRPVKDRFVGAGVKIAYSDLTPSGRHARVVLMIEIDPYEVDVNVHPSKAEVRFRYPLMIRDLVFSSIKGLLGSSHQVAEPIALGSFSSSAEFSKSRAPAAFGVFPSTSAKLSRNLFEPPQQLLEPKDSLGSACFQIGDSFIVSRAEECIIIVDQSAAHERMIYESLKGKKYLESRSLNDFIEVAVSDPHNFSQNQALLESFGLCTAVKGSSVIVKSTPLILFNCCIQALISDLENSFLETDDLTAPERIRKVWSCHYAMRKNLSLDEMNLVLRQLESTPNSDQYIHGKPCYVKLSKAQVEKWFEG